MENIFYDIGIITILATAFAYLARKLRQPLIPAYILSGFLLLKAGLITDVVTVRTLSEIGIAFMLFTVGLEFELRKLRKIGKIFVVGGSLQIVITTIIAFIVMMLLNFNTLISFYLALVVAFSSTMVVVKLLSDRNELDTLHAKITIAILLVQDIAAVLAISFLPILDSISFNTIMLFVAKTMAILVLIIVSPYFLKPLFNFAAKHQELLLLGALAVCFTFIFIMQTAGFSTAIGAFIAGVLLANLPYRLEIIGKMTPLRDFFVTLFFVSLGLELVEVNFSNILTPLIVILLLVLILKPFIVLMITSLFHYERKTSFLTATSLAQTSEFSLVLGFQGLMLNHIPKDVFSLMLLVTIISITITTYLMKYDKKIYKLLSHHLRFFEIKPKETSFIKEKDFDVVLFGCNRLGYSILRALTKLNTKFVVVDYDPEVIELLTKSGIQCIYGDATDPEILEKIDIKRPKLFISTVADRDDNLYLLKKIKEKNKDALVFLTATQLDDALEFYEAGAHYVIIPRFLGGDYAALLVEKFSKNINEIIKEKARHIEELKMRKRVSRAHPLHKEFRRA